MPDFTPHTDEEISEMLAACGLSNIDELFDAVPEALRLAGGLDMADQMSEPDVMAEMNRLASANSGANLICFAGGGAYDHEVPSVVRRLGFRSEFVTAYTPYQPEVAQGVLQMLFEYQTLVARLAGLAVANASLYDGASALVEAANLSVAAQRRPQLWVSEGIHPTWREVLRTFAQGTGHDIVEVPLKDGVTDWAAAGDGEPAALMLAQPNHLGCLEDVSGAAESGARQGSPLRSGCRPRLRRAVALARRTGSRRSGGGGADLRNADVVRRALRGPLRFHPRPGSPPSRPTGGRDRWTPKVGGPT